MPGLNDGKIREFGAFRSRSRAVRPVTLRREKAYLPETVVSLGPKFLATIGSSPAREAGGLLEVSVKELQRPPPRQIRRRRVILGYRELSFPDQRLVGEGVLGLIAVELEPHVRRPQLLFEKVDGRDRERHVLDRVVAEERRLDLRRIDVFERRKAVPDDGRVGLGDVDSGKERQRPAETKAGDADLPTLPLQVLDTAAHVLTRCVAEVQVGHQVLGLFRLDRDLPPVEIRHQRPVTSSGHAVRYSFDLGVPTTPGSPWLASVGELSRRHPTPHATTTAGIVNGARRRPLR